MAALELRNKKFRVVFMYGGRKFGYSLDTGDRQTADALRGGVEKILMLIEQRALRLPEGADIVAFVKAGGRLEEPAVPPPESLTLQKHTEGYLAAHSVGAMEQNSLDTVRLHLGHFTETLGERFDIRALTLDDLQKHVDRRAKKKYRGRTLSPVTLRKEMASFRACWNWGLQAGKLTTVFPNRGLKFPKGDEKPPFQTRADIERRVERGGLSAAEIRELWDCLFLTRPEIAELIEYVKGHASHPFLYPMFCFAAHTGARRSEILRARIDDVDFVSMTVLLHEKKRSRGKRTSRRVPVSHALAAVLKEWLASHPGGQYLFCHASEVGRSKKRSRTTGHQDEKTRPSSLRGRMATVRKRATAALVALTKDEAQDHFQRTLDGSKWDVLKGWHALRHSFASNCAAAGVDQRVIDEWMGHQTEEMVRRYRHLFPEQQRSAIDSVFGKG